MLYDLGFHHMEASFSPEGPKSFFLTLSPLLINSRPMDCTSEPSQKPLHEVCHVETGDHLMQISPYKRKQDHQNKLLLSCGHSSQNMNNKLINLKDNLPKKNH